MCNQVNQNSISHLSSVCHVHDTYHVLLGSKTNFWTAIVKMYSGQLQSNRRGVYPQGWGRSMHLLYI